MKHEAQLYASGRISAWPDAAKEGWRNDLRNFIRNRAIDNLRSGRPITVSGVEIERHIPQFKKNAEGRSNYAKLRDAKKGSSSTFKTKAIHVINPASQALVDGRA